jgi:hypothetical protein
VLLQDAGMSGGVSGPLGYVAGPSVLMSPFLMCVVCYSFLNELPFAGQMASFIQVTAGQPALPLAGWQI